MLGNFNQAQNATETALNSAGSAMQENAAYMEGLEASLDKLKATWQNFANNVLSSDFVKWALDAANALLEFANTGFGQVIVKGAILATTLTAIVGGGAKLKAIFSDVSLINRFGSSILKLGSDFITAFSMVRSFKDGLVALELVIEAHPLGAFITILGAAVGVAKLATNAIEKHQQALEEDARASLEAANKQAEAAQNLKELVSQYEELTAIEERTNEQEFQYLDINAQIIKALGDRAIELKGLKAGTEEYTQALKEMTQAEIDSSVGDAYKAATDAAEALTNKAKSEGTGLYFPREDFDRWKELFKDIEGVQIEEETKSVYFTFDRNDADSLLAFYNSLQKVQSKLNQEAEETGDTSIFETQIYTSLEGILRRLSDTTNAYAEARTVLYQQKAFQQIFEAEEQGIIDSKKAFDAYIRAIQSNAQYTEEYKQILIETAKEAYPQYVSATQKAVGAASEFKAQLNDVSKVVREEFEETGSISVETLNKLEKAFPGATDALVDAKGELTDVGKAALASNSAFSKFISGFKKVSVEVKNIDTGNVNSFVETLKEVKSTFEENRTKGEALTSFYEAMEGPIKSASNAQEEQVNVLKRLIQQYPSLQQAMYNADGTLTTLGKQALSNVNIFYTLANSFKTVEVASRQMSLADAISELESLETAALFSVGAMDYYVKLKNAIDAAKSDLPDFTIPTPTGGGGGSSEDKRLTALKNVVSTRKSELTLMEKQGKSADEQVEKMKQIQQALHEQAEYLRATEAAQSDINALSSEWWDIQENINELLKEQYDNRIALLESELSLLEKTSASDDERISKIKDIQSELEAEYRFMQDIGSSQEELNELAAKWYDLQEDINSILRDTAQKQIDAIQDQIDQLETAIDYVVDKAQEEIDKLEDAKDAVEARYDAEKERIQEQIDNLEKTNDALEKEITLQEKLDALARAKAKKKYVYKDGRFQYVDDIDAINEAQKELNDFIDEQARQEAIDNLNKGIDDLESAKNKELEILDQEIKGWEDFQKQWGSIVDNYQKEQDRLIAEQVFGINLEGQNWETRLGNLQSYVSRYNDLQSQLKQAQANYDSIGSGGASFEPGASSAEQQKQNIIAQMKANSAAWMVAYNAGDKAEMARLEAENQRLGAMIGAVYNSGQGKWYDGTTGLPLYAKGTISAKGGISIVGEEGAEMRILNKGDGIIPANMTANLMEIGKYSLPELLSMAGGSEGGATTIHIETVELPNVRDVDDFVTTLANNFVNRAIQVGSNRT